MDREEQRKDQVMKSQGYGVSIEHILRRIFNNCDTDGFLGLISSNMARRYPYNTMMYGFAYLYGNVTEETKEKMQIFSDKYFDYADLRIDDMLSFTHSGETLSFNDSDYSIDAENGIKFVEQMIADYENAIQ